MAKRKKGKTKAQAAAARYEKTPESIKRAEAKERSRLIKKSAQNAQKKASQASGLRMLLPFILMAGLIVAALAFTVVPGLIVSGS